MGTGGDIARRPEDKGQSYLHVETDRVTREKFSAACHLLGGTVKARVNEFMARTIREAGITTIATH